MSQGVSVNASTNTIVPPSMIHHESYHEILVMSVSIVMSKYNKILCIMVHYQRKGKQIKGQDVDMPQKVKDPISCEKVHVMAQFKPSRHCIHLK